MWVIIEMAVTLEQYIQPFSLQGPTFSQEIFEALTEIFLLCTSAMTKLFLTRETTVNKWKQLNANNFFIPEV